MNVTLTEQEWMVALNAMALGPYREVQPTIQKISNQLMEQKASEKPE